MAIWALHFILWLITIEFMRYFLVLYLVTCFLVCCYGS